MENKKMLEDAKNNSRMRINELIQTHCDGSQQRFVEKTGLSKAAVSQYVNGKKSLTNLAASTIGDTFNVSVGWVLGFEVERSNHAFERYLTYAEQISKQPALKELIDLLNDCNCTQINAIKDIIIAFKNNEE